MSTGPSQPLQAVTCLPEASSLLPPIPVDRTDQHWDKQEKERKSACVSNIRSLNSKDALCISLGGG